MVVELVLHEACMLHACIRVRGLFFIFRSRSGSMDCCAIFRSLNWHKLLPYSDGLRESLVMYLGKWFEFQLGLRDK